MKRKKNILLICPTFYPIPGGSETFYLDFLKYLVKKECKIEVSACGYRQTKLPFHYNPTKIKLRIVPILNKNILSFISKNVILYYIYIFPFLFINSFITMIKSHRKIDYIYSNSVTAGLTGLILAKLFQKPSAIITHGGINFENSQHARYSKIIAWIYLHHNFVFACGESFKKELITLGIDKSKILDYTHWVDSNLFTPKNRKLIRSKFKWNNKFVILFTGRLVKEKGINDILQVARTINQDDILFVFTGKGNLEKNVMHEALKKDNVQYAGWVNLETLPEYYNGADIVVMPSKTDFESYNRTLIESLFCGTPIIATKKGAMISTVDPSVGLLINSSASDLKEAIHKLYFSKEIYVNMRKTCRKYAQNKFSEKNAKVFLQIL